MEKSVLDKPGNFNNRELSWLKFNLRVLKEAGVKDKPLFERLKFVSIASSNLDEFFMVRVAGLKDQLVGHTWLEDISGLTVSEQLEQIAHGAHTLVKLKYRYLFAILKELREENIYFDRVSALNETGRRWVEEYFQDTIYPVLTPMAVDAGHPFPFLGNRTLNLAVELLRKKGEKATAVVQVPSVLPRLVEVQTGQKKRAFVFLEDIIMEYISQLFQGCDIGEILPFRITRNSDLSFAEEEAEDLMLEVERSLRRRKWGDAVRLEIVRSANSRIRHFLQDCLELENQDVYEINGPLDPTCFMKFSNLPGYDHLRFAPFKPQTPAELLDAEDIWQRIRTEDVLLHHPFESFDSVVGFVANAATDPQVLAIKQTLYRVSGNSPIVAALARAAENGKQVTVLVELKARFDEENNILWAKQLEEAGCHVIYGLLGLKTHAKTTLVVRRESDGIRRYVHLSTGNYNDSTAKQYTDIGLLTANEAFGRDASAFFNVLSGYSDPPVWNKFVVAPMGLREKIYELIEQEMRHAKAGRRGHIVAKMNSLIDKEVILKLYEASCAGVEIELIVRGICGLRPGVPGVSENITVRSIVGRLLEHSRIFYFANGGNELVFLSSADWMPRNLNERVELLFPVDNERYKERIKGILTLYLEDSVKAHVMQSNGIYRRAQPKPDAVSSQAELYRQAVEAAELPVIPLTKRLQPLYRKEE